MNEKFCECEKITDVARDGKSTCCQCGGIDAYKKSPLRKPKTTFEEEQEFFKRFPLLAKKILSDIDVFDPDKVYETWIKDIMECCRDNQRIKEAILKIFGKTNSEGVKYLRTTGEDAEAILLLIELGLEE